MNFQYPVMKIGMFLATRFQLQEVENKYSAVYIHIYYHNLCRQIISYQTTKGIFNHNDPDVP